MRQLLDRTVRRPLQWLSVALPNEPAVVVPGGPPRQRKARVHMKTYTRTVLAALLGMAQTEKNPNVHPGSDKTCPVHTVAYDPAMKGKKR